ncbi:MAG: aminodeoxychorismate lyase [Gammaproteobacteria bacterium]|nr:aminodeoxychorismate lyase [Gammaproteobacteria bacterium]
MDRGLQYGDGLFETIKVVQGRAEFWQRHIDRLQQGCSRLGIAMPDQVLLEAEAATLCADQDEAVLKILLTRGSGGRGYRCSEDSTPNRIISLSPMPDYRAQNLIQGMTVRLCQQRLSINPTLAGIKHLNRLEQVLARREWDDAAVFEGLMQDMDGNVIEGVMSNLFMVDNGYLLTPDLSRAGVCGVMRSVIIDLAQTLNIKVLMQDISQQQLLQADEMFICNSLMGITPVQQINEQRFATGAVTRTLLTALQEADKEWALCSNA